MGGTMNWIDLYRSKYIESRLLKSKRHAARTRKQIDSDRSLISHNPQSF
jgi:hypothetical protein